MTPVYRPGQFVWCRFPTAEQPEAPGPKSRIGYVLAVRRIGRADVAAMLYTTTARWPTDAARPLGVIPIDEPRARSIGQKPFMIDVRTAAALPIAIEFFPHLERADHGIQGLGSAGRGQGLAAEESLIARIAAAVAKLRPPTLPSFFLRGVTPMLAASASRSRTSHAGSSHC